MSLILIVAPPLTGHINPALSVAGELRRHGHHVAWAVHADLIPNDLLPADAEIYPLPVQLRSDANKRSTQVRGWDSVKFFYEDVYLPLARASLRPLEQIVRSVRPDLIICDHQMISGALVARALNIPWLTFASTNVSILKLTNISLLMANTVELWIEQQLAELQREYALPVLPRPDFSPHGVVVFSSEALLAGRYEYHNAQYHFVGPALTDRPSEIEFPWGELWRDAAKLLISLGTVNRDRSVHFYEIVMEALDRLELDDTYPPYRKLQVVLVGPEELRAHAPANFIVRPRVPQITLLGHVDAVLCHGGHNTVCEALAFGLPLIVAPIRDDQPIVARQVIDAGAARYLRYGKITPTSVRAAVQEIFCQRSYRDNALRLKESFTGLRGARGAADIVEQLLTGPIVKATEHARTGACRAMG